MQFKAFVELLPRWPFGVPNGEDQIVPAGGGEFHTHPILAGTLRQFGFNTMPEYRDESQAVSHSVVHQDWSAKIHDNFLELSLATGREDFQDRLAEILDSVCADLSIRMGTRFSYRVHMMQGENGNPVNRFAVRFPGFFSYDLRETSDAVRAAFESPLPTSVQYRKAIRYFMHAKLLQEQIWTLADPGTEDEAFIAASGVLNFWKSATCLLGERPTRGWTHSSELVALKMEAFAPELETLGNLRNHWDVAHARLDDRGRKLAETELARAAGIASKLLAAFRDASRSPANTS